MGILSIFLFSIVFGSLHDFASTISTCEMCYSCDNPCQPIVSPPPPPSPPPVPVLSPPPPFPPPVTGTGCPPPAPMPSLPELNHCPPPPPSNGGGVGVYYFSPPPPTEPTYFPPLYGGGGTYSPPQNFPYSWPNPTFPYLPFSNYLCPPRPAGISISHSAKLNTHPFVSASLVIFFCLLFIP